MSGRTERPHHGRVRDMSATTILCTTCPEGGPYSNWDGWTGWTCESCGHVISTWDVDLEDDERLTTDADGCLAYVTVGE